MLKRISHIVRTSTLLCFTALLSSQLIHAQQWVQKGLDLEGEAADDLFGGVISMPNVNTIAIGTRFNDGNGLNSGHVRVFSWDGSNWVQKGQDFDGDAVEDYLGGSVCMPTANTIAIGATHNDANGLNAGHVKIFSWNGTSWIPKGTPILGAAAGDQCGASVSMPNENTIVIGASHYDGNGSNSGHARIYDWDGIGWSQRGADIFGENSGDQSGLAVSMPDINTVAIGAPSNALNGAASGQVRVFNWNGTNWVPKGLSIYGDAAFDVFGRSVDMPNANTIAIAAYLNDTNGSNAGQVKIYTWNGSSWTQKGTDLIGESAGDNFGISINMFDADNIIVGARNDDGNGSNSGHAKVFQWNGSAWLQVGQDIDGEAAGDELGWSVSLPALGTVGVGATRNDGSGTDAGHVRVFDYCQITYSTDIHIACDTFTWIDGNSYSSSNTTATWTTVNAAGCDSIITLNLTMNNSSSFIDTINACDSYTWIDGNTYFASNDTATWVIPNAAGCDSVITLHLMINNNASTDTVVSCGDYIWIDGNTYTTSNTTATYTLTNGAGCDSIVTLNLTVNTLPDVSTTTSELTISANNGNATYQWLNCDANFSILQGEVGNTFTATANGNYAVQLTENGCVDTSACVAITTVQVDEEALNHQFKLYPNPGETAVSLEIMNDLWTHYVVSDMTGRSIQMGQFKNSVVLQLESLESGSYLIRVQNDLGDAQRIWVKQ
jgi:hypothetical protein